MVPGAAGNCLLEPFSQCVTLVGGGVFRGLTSPMFQQHGSWCCWQLFVGAL